MISLNMLPFAALFHYNSNWNIILFVIAGCSLVSFTVFFDRLFILYRSEIDTNQLLIALKKEIENDNIVAAIRICEESPGTVSNIIKSGLSRHDQQQERIENAMEMSGLIEIAKLDKNTKILSMIAHITPLIGLLGTVLGFIQAFSEMRLSGLVDISATRIGEALEYALVTTAAGLVVAIPSVVAYNYIVNRIAGFILEIQTTSSFIVDLLIHKETY